MTSMGLRAAAPRLACCGIGPGRSRSRCSRTFARVFQVQDALRRVKKSPDDCSVRLAMKSQKKVDGCAAKISMARAGTTCALAAGARTISARTSPWMRTLRRRTRSRWSRRTDRSQIHPAELSFMKVIEAQSIFIQSQQIRRCRSVIAPWLALPAVQG